MAWGGVGGGAREQWEQQPPTTLPFLPWEVWGVGQGGGRGGRGRWVGEGAGQKRAGGPVVVLGHEGGIRAEGSEVERRVGQGGGQGGGDGGSREVGGEVERVTRCGGL